MDKTVGVLGGGQLGRMLLEESNRLNITTNVLDAANSPAKQIAHSGTHINGSFKNADDVRKLAARSDVVTIEIEHVDVPILHELAAEGASIHPDPATIKMIQDKYLQKEYYVRHKIATAKSVAVIGASQSELATSIKSIGADIGFPLVLKARKDAYDGRGNAVVKDSSDAEIRRAIEALGDRSLYAEQFCKFQKELAVMVVKTKQNDNLPWSDSTLAYPVVETVHQDSICKLTYCPPRNVSSDIQNNARKLAQEAVAGFKGKGIYGVEMFLLEDGQLLVNEIAPRPHNSGHYTIDACRVSQFGAHLRSILDLPLTQDHLATHSPSVMLNILGGATSKSHLRLAEAALAVPGASVHLYGKGGGRPGRKMGHITVTAKSLEEAEKAIEPLIKTFDQIREETAEPKNSTDEKPVESSKQAIEGVARVAVIMGSYSDLDKLVPGIELLDHLQIPRRVDIVSAHRTPERMVEFARDAEKKGYEVIIAAAGGAAHLPGMVASETLLPVLGVPIKSAGSDGRSAIASILDMPRGCPVATFSPNNGINAALEAARILALKDPAIRARLDAYHRFQTQTVLADSQDLQNLDVVAFLEHKKKST